MGKSLTIAEKINAIINWQTDERMHSLTCDCGNNTPFKTIEIDIVSKSVKLKCENCGMIQEWIPNSVLEYYLDSQK